MDQKEYAEGLARTILPEGFNYEFENINVISEIDENGEIQIEIVGRADVDSEEGTKDFLQQFYESSGATFNVKSGRADRSGKDTRVRGYRKCIMQVQQKQKTTPKTKGLHQDCGADLTFRLEIPKPLHPFSFIEF